MLAVSTPFAAAARTLPRSQESATAEPTHRQLRVLHSYERYMTRMRAQSVKATRAVRFAYRQVGKPYRWGGAGPRSYDCSGLVMAAWRKGGLRLPHRADLQHRMIRRKVALKHLRPGDLVFFSGDHHVGIYVGHRHFLHAPHTGTRVQRGTLSGWRLRAFAGAARPGAPAYHAWPHWVHTLADHDSRHGAGKTRHPHGAHAATEPGTTRPDDASGIDAPPSGAIPEPGDGVDDQAPGTSPDTAPPPVPPAPAPAAGLGPSAGSPAGPSGTHGLTPPAAPPAPVPKAPAATPVAPPVAAKPVPPAPDVIASRPSAHGPGDLAFSLLNMAAPAPRWHHDAVVADGTPVPPPGPPQNRRPRPRWPRNSVQHRNDEQRIDRDYTDADGADDDVDSGNDGIDLRSLLGVVP